MKVKTALNDHVYIRYRKFIMVICIIITYTIWDDQVVVDCDWTNPGKNFHFWWFTWYPAVNRIPSWHDNVVCGLSLEFKRSKTFKDLWYTVFITLLTSSRSKMAKKSYQIWAVRDCPFIRRTSSSIGWSRPIYETWRWVVSTNISIVQCVLNSSRGA